MEKVHITGRELATGRCMTIAVEQGVIASVAPAIDACDLWLAPGLIDLQVNGYRGFDLNGGDLSADTVSRLVRVLLATGVTTFAPTLMTASEPELLQRLASIAESIDLDPIAQMCIPCIHVEGPHISPFDGYRGAHRADAVRPPSIEEFERWQARCHGLVGMVTMSPHFANTEKYIAHLVGRGVHVSLGHTHASHAQIEIAVNAGACLSTHLGNGVPFNLTRHPNPIWSQLADDRLTASFIADGHHLPAEAFKAMLRAKGFGRSLLVSDAVTLAGMPPGRYVAPAGPVELSADGRLRQVDSELLAGATVPLISCVVKAAKMTASPLHEVFKMATENPGRFAQGRGRLLPGVRADVIRFELPERDDVLNLTDVWLAGERIELDA